MLCICKYSRTGIEKKPSRTRLRNQVHGPRIIIQHRFGLLGRDREIRLSVRDVSYGIDSALSDEIAESVSQSEMFPKESLRTSRTRLRNQAPGPRFILQFGGGRSGGALLTEAGEHVVIKKT